MVWSKQIPVNLVFQWLLITGNAARSQIPVTGLERRVESGRVNVVFSPRKARPDNSGPVAKERCIASPVLTRMYCCSSDIALGRRVMRGCLEPERVIRRVSWWKQCGGKPCSR